MSATIHAAAPGSGDHRTDGTRCWCSPDVLVDVNAPDRLVIVHRTTSERPLPRAALSTVSASPRPTVSTRRPGLGHAPKESHP